MQVPGGMINPPPECNCARLATLTETSNTRRYSNADKRAPLSIDFRFTPDAVALIQFALNNNKPIYTESGPFSLALRPR